MLPSKLISFLSEYVPEYNSKKYLLAVSGGMDSMLMLHLFHSLKLNFNVAHCNFNLRGNDSLADEALVYDTCKKLSIPCFVKHFDTLKEKENQNEGTQLVARRLRYEWFESVRLESGIDFICTAHHQRDNIETIVYRFMNGAFPESMQGIKPVNEKVIRPLLFVPYNELRQFSLTISLAYREDQSNQTNDYSRNKIRHELLPAIEAVFGAHAFHKIESVTGHYKAYFDLLKHQSAQLLKPHRTWFEISLQQLRSTPGNTALLYEAIKNYGFHWKACEEICSDLNREIGSIIESNDRLYRIYFANETLQLLPSSRTPFYETIVLNDHEQCIRTANGGNIYISVITRQALNGFESNILYFDYDLISSSLNLREYQSEDSFHPMGLTGTKRVHDFLKDLKLSPAEKQYQLVLESNNQVVGIVGHRIDESMKVTDQTKRVMTLKVVY